MATKVKKIVRGSIIALKARPLPKTLVQAAGLLSGKLKKTPLQYQKSARKEWK